MIHRKKNDLLYKGEGEFTYTGEQVVNRLKVPQGLSTPMLRQWSEFPSRGGVRGDSP